MGSCRQNMRCLSDAYPHQPKPTAVSVRHHLVRPSNYDDREIRSGFRMSATAFYYLNYQSTMSIFWRNMKEDDQGSSKEKPPVIFNLFI